MREDFKSMSIPSNDLQKVQSAIDEVKSNGSLIRNIFENHANPQTAIEWEVDAAVECFQIFSSRWTIEILAALYIAGDRRFNEMRTLLRGISSRTLSDKLSACQKSGLVDRVVEDLSLIHI